MKIGLIADTHGQLHPSVYRYFAGVDMILHAGDIGSAKVLEDLSAIAPVQAVAGNMDRPPLSTTYPMHRLLELRGMPVLLLHRPPSLTDLEELARTCGRRPEVVVHGHTHCRRLERRRGVLFVNPGAASTQGASPSVAVLELEDRVAPSAVFYDL